MIKAFLPVKPAITIARTLLDIASTTSLVFKARLALSASVVLLKDKELSEDVQPILASKLTPRLCNRYPEETVQLLELLKQSEQSLQIFTAINTESSGPQHTLFKFTNVKYTRFMREIVSTNSNGRIFNDNTLALCICRMQLDDVEELLDGEVNSARMN